MALIRKTYSRRNAEVSGVQDAEKENVDPFDELLSSPLKQKVEFQPLSYWGKSVKDLDSKSSRKIKYRLYELSDSDEISSPHQRKMKTKSKYALSKARTLPSKSTNQKLGTRGINISSTLDSLRKRSKPKAPNRKALRPDEEIKNSKGWSLNNILYPNDRIKETFSSNHTGCDDFKHISRYLDKTSEKNNPFNKALNSLSGVKNFQEESLRFVSEGLNNSKFKIYEDTIYSSEKLEESCNVKDSLKDSINSSANFNNDMEETFYKHENNYKFVSTRRCYNFQNFSLNETLHRGCQRESWENSQTFSNPSNFENEESVENLNDEILLYHDDFINSTNESLEETCCYVPNATLVNNESSELPMVECLGENDVSDDFDLMDLNATQIEELIQKLHKYQNVNISETSPTSDDTLSEFNNWDTIIKGSVELGESNEKNTDSPLLKDISHCSSPSKEMSFVTSGISDLTLSNVTHNGLSELETKNLDIIQDELTYKDKDKSPFMIDLRNITKRNGLNRKPQKNIYYDSNRLSRLHETQRENTDFEFDCELSRITNSMSLDSNKTVFFPNPVFESTRVLDTSVFYRKADDRPDGIIESTRLNHTYALKPGKKWRRSMSVLKQLQNGNISGCRFESTRITGRKFESFVQDVLEMQSEKTGFLGFSSSDITAASKSFKVGNITSDLSNFSSACETIVENENLQPDASVISDISEYFTVDDILLSKTVSDKTTFESSILSRTVQVIQPEDKPSAFRSALGLETSVRGNSVQGETSISAKDFILMQCGQQDVLPFEDHFNERTLKNCRKIGEGVYGEVFMSSDSVIKIIPIEGSDKVNEERQKTFEEIISEVVIALKLSGLRKGENYRTDGFSEMKRCWCVRGKYPKYLLRLWDEYDRLGNGSENDSPVMFKDDQLYIILELGNGGKSMEAFVFNSSAQSLSIFIQTVFSLAAAEKAFEFEHRDLHWGNVLISETKEKFMTVLLDGVEYNIPTKGVKVCIIDFTLSRMNYEGCCIFNDLSVDPTLFISEGDYQFEIYRMMLREVRNDWSLFRPKTNIFWLHYTIDKIIKQVHYKNKKTKTHAKHLKDLKILESIILQNKDSTNFALSDFMSDVIHKL